MSKEKFISKVIIDEFECMTLEDKVNMFIDSNREYNYIAKEIRYMENYALITFEREV